jgi:hypothetical protein
MTPQRISLTDFVDFVSMAGTSKATKVAEIKGRSEYQPAFDFWKPLRKHIIHVHASGGDKSELDEILTTVNDPRKLGLYRTALQGYRRFWGRKSLEWFDPPRSAFSASGIEVAVNPELGLRIDGASCLIKLYFKAERLAKRRVDVILYLMEHELSSKCPDTTFAVLDVQRGNAIGPTVTVPRLHASLVGELAYFATVWETI